MSNTKAIRTRIKSVHSTMHITRAMQLVASSKIRRALERMEGSRFFFHAISDAFRALTQGGTASPYLTPRPVKHTLCIVLAGDRGLAGGYNANVFRLAKEHLASKDASVITIGKRACDYFESHGYTARLAIPSLEKITSSQIFEAVSLAKRLFDAGEVDEVTLIYTDCISMLSQETRLQTLLPLTPPEADGEAPKSKALTLYEPSPEAVLNAVIPQYLTGVLQGAADMSYAAELASRQNAMDSATKNAEEMIEKLSLSYNRARQAAITQEITEIVAGAEQ